MEINAKLATQPAEKAQSLPKTETSNTENKQSANLTPKRIQHDDPVAAVFQAYYDIGSFPFRLLEHCCGIKILSD